MSSKLWSRGPYLFLLASFLAGSVAIAAWQTRTNPGSNVVANFVLGLATVGVIGGVVFVGAFLLARVVGAKGGPRSQRVAAIFAGLMCLTALAESSAPSPQNQNSVAATPPDASLSANEKTPAEDKHAERQALADYWNTIAYKYIEVRANYAAVGASAYSNDPVGASSELKKASDEADGDQLDVATTATPDGFSFADACPGPNMMFEYLKQSFDGMRSSLDDGKPSEASDAQDKVQQADAWFFECRHEVAGRYAELGGDPKALQSMHVPSN